MAVWMRCSAFLLLLLILLGGCLEGSSSDVYYFKDVNQTGVDSNQVKVSSNDTTAGYLNGKLVAGSNITLTENNNGGNETLTIASTASGSGTSCDNNADCNISGRINTNYDANFNKDLNVQNNINLDGNLYAKDVNTYIGAPSSSNIIVNALQYVANIATRGANLTINGNTYAFCVVGTNPCSGMYFSASDGIRGFRMDIAGVPVWYIGTGGGSGVVWQGARTSNPTAGSGAGLGGSYYVLDSITTTNPWDGNNLVINQGISASQNYERVGSRLVKQVVQNDVNIGRDLNVHQNVYIDVNLDVRNDVNIGRDLNVERNLYVDGNFLHGGHWSLFSVIGTSCNTLCGAITVDAPWACVQAITTAGVASTCAQTLVAVNCLCKN